MVTRLIKKIATHPTIRKWELIDRKIELRQKQNRTELIEQIMPKNGIGAELGVFKGHLSPLLLQKTQAKTLHLIDPWYFLSPKWDWATGNQSTVDGLRNVLHIFKKDIEQGRILVHVGDDLHILSTFAGQTFDWVYIDSSHEYEHTKQELQILAHKVKATGVIAGDDWLPDPTHRHHGVYKAVNEFIAAENYQLIYANEANRQWAIKKNT